MDSLGLPTPQPSSGWFLFLGILVAVCIPVAVGVIWYAVTHRNKKRRRKRRHHSHRRHRTTLADRGGLPPMRDPNKPPSGL